MIDRLKVIELLRYNINSNVERVSEKLIKEQSDTTNETICAVFATGFSLVSVEVGNAIYYLVRETPWATNVAKWISRPVFRHCLAVFAKASFVVIVFSLVFAVSYYIAKKTRAKHVRWKKARELHITRESDYKRFIDEFDHTACDALLFSEYFLDASNTEDEQKKQFNLYEAMYYLGKAQSITMIIFNNIGNCVSSTKSNKIATHRLINTVKMMEDIKKKIDDKIEDITIDRVEEESLKASQQKLSTTMQGLNSELDKLYSSAKIEPPQSP